MKPEQLKSLLQARFGDRWPERAGRYLGVSPGEVHRWVAGTRRLPRRKLVLLLDSADAGERAVEAEIRRRHDQLDAELRHRLSALRQVALLSRAALSRRGGRQSVAADGEP